ncbi:LuxR C-terminal-related transcriptional regulator [Leifsonia sp. Root112D2]|uniref:LuxR C-terminal-related transcriptional regulator n=1 Tax=Leifsonia sp. Root112D2 TaxID=1736426 RepID=UPI0009E90D1C|nr:LuxR C-terminal-related transcriptional regulator [Leifsonia sp. Root112D2]
MQSTGGVGDPVRAQSPAAADRDGVISHWSRALPRPPENVIRRDRLHAVIDKNRALTVVQGPAGFGKTTLVAEWANARDEHSDVTVWMDATHSDPRTFWSDVATAFAESGILLESSADSPYLAILASVHARSSELTLVIDRFDTVADRQIQDSLHELIMRRRWLRVITCVRRGDIFTSVLWSDLSVSTIRAHDLAFTADETAQLTRELGVELDNDDIRSLHNAGQGWPEPTRALALELGRPAQRVTDIETAAGRVAREYLQRRLLPEFENDEQLDFILATAVPESVTEEIAAMLTGDAQSGRHLRHLETEGVLTANRDDDEIVYRWPSAARAALCEEFSRRKPQRATELNSRLAAWYFTRQSFVSAIKHAMVANDVELAVQIIERGWPELLKLHVPELDAALTAIPLELIAAYPQAAAIRDIRLHLAAQGDDFLLSLPDPLPNDPQHLESLARSDRSLQAMNTATAMMIALRVRGRVAKAAHYGNMVEQIGRVGRFHQPDTMASFVPNAFLQLGITRGFADDLPGAIQILRVAYELAPSSESEHVLVDSAGKLALFSALRGNTAQTMFWLDRHDRPYRKSDWMARWVSLGGAIARTLAAIEGLDQAAATDAIPHMKLASREEQNWSPFVTFAGSRHALHWGDRLGALALLREERAHHRAWLRKGSTMRPLLDAAEAELLIALGLANQAEHLLTNAPRHSALDAPRARFALLTGQPERALRRATAGLARAGAHPSQAELLLISASAENRMGNTTAARESFRGAFDNARATGSLRSLSTMPSDERSALAAGVSGISELLRQIETTPNPFPSELRLIELTEREQLILERIAKGMSVQAVAEDLFVSRNTVKTQMRSLYQKLDVSSRDEAVARAHEYGLFGAPAHRDDD